MSSRSDPSNLELNRHLQATQPQQFLVDVLDFAAPVTEVKVRLRSLPLEVPLKRVAGNTWRGELTSDQIRRMAVNGKRIEYEADVIARDSNGAVAPNGQGLKFSIQAPELGRG